MPLKKRRNPPEKKLLSLSKDRRACFGESNKGPRVSIPRNKSKANRALRRSDAADLRLDPETAEARLPLRLRRRWRKCPDQPLEAIVDNKLRARKDRVGGKKRRLLAQRPNL